MKRKLIENLFEWKNDPRKKPILLRGARQVGKTWLIRELGKSFKYFIEVNFEENRQASNFFKEDLNPLRISELLSIYYDTPVIPGDTLVFFDEIQSCPDALSSLRFFHEKLPELHIAAAGSLLEIAIADIPSFGVGRIESLFLYPMTFFEYLDAMGNSKLKEEIKKASFDRPLNDVLHIKALDLFKRYQITGGLPEVVETYSETADIRACQKILDGLILSFQDDFAKYKQRSPVDKISEVFKSLAFQAGGKFTYSRISGERSSVYRQALDLLVKAGLAYKIIHSSARGIPLAAQVNDKRFKACLFDSGIYQRLLGLDLGSFIISNPEELINKGNLAEVTVCNLLAAASNPNARPELYYWHREQRGSNAEVDYIISLNGRIIPIEVKSGTKGSMQSMFIFMNERNLNSGIRISAENFARYGKILVLPVYASESVFTRQYLSA